MLHSPTRALSKTLVDRGSLTSLFVFLFFVLVPQQFAYVQKEVQKQWFVQPAYANLLGDQWAKGIAFEQLLGDASTPIVSYKVKKGDTVEDVAKEFWTTVRALRKANGLSPTDVLLAGQTLKIAYDDGIVYEVEKPQTIEAFAAEYHLDLEDVMSLNYIIDASTKLEVGQELFLDLNQGEAEAKWLIKKKEYKEVYVPMDLPPSEDEYADSYVAAVVDGDTQHTDEPVQVDSSESSAVDSDTQNQEPVQDQDVVAPEQKEVQQQVVYQQAQGQEVIKAGEKKEEQPLLKSVAQPAKEKEAAKTAQVPAKPEPTKEPAKIAQVKTVSQPANAGVVVAKSPTQDAVKKPVSVSKEAATPSKETKKENKLTCPDNVCPYQGKCVQKPENAFCVDPTPTRARTCKEGYREEGHVCVDEATWQKQQKEKETAEKKWWIVQFAYVNPKKDGFGGQGFARGNCTYYAAYVWWKAGHSVTWRGNGGRWLDNAAAAWYATGKKPTVWSIAVFRKWWGGLGHVAIVSAVDGDNIRLEEMNYKWRGIHSTRWISVSDSGVWGFIYPPKR